LVLDIDLDDEHLNDSDCALLNVSLLWILP